MRPLAALVAVLAAMAALLIAYHAGPARAEGVCSTNTAGTTTCTFVSTGAEDTFVVPAGVNTIHVEAIGAPGAVGFNGGSAGSGAQVSGNLKVTPGDTLYVNVGGAPTGGSNCFDIACNAGFNGGGSGRLFGGGGGGASDVRTVSRDQSASLDSRLIVAGGGGGSGEGASSCYDENGDPGPILKGGRGGDAGSDGGDGTSCRSLAGGTGGKAGTQSEGGVGGSPGGQSGERGGDGSLGLGGNSGGTGGGGGGGYYGGGGGGGRGRADTREAPAGGGGGGSSLVPTGGSGPTITSDSPSITISATPSIVVDRTDDPALSTTPTAGNCTAAANDCSLRGAITAANSSSGAADTIVFDLDSPATITLASSLGQLPSITDAPPGLIIDGGDAEITVSGGGEVRVFGVGNGAKLALENLTVSNGWAGGGESAFDEFGGGAFNNGGTLTISNSTFSDNDSVTAGGGVANEQGMVIVTDSTFSHNSAQGGVGGGVTYNRTGTLTVSNSTFSGNSASARSGGGILNDATLNVSNSTFSGNSADDGGGGIANFGTSTLKNTIVANSKIPDVDGTTPQSNCVGTITDGGYNLSSDKTCGFSAANNSQSGTFDPSMGDGVILDPMLGPLADNGGPTKTHAQLVGSPAIDKGKAFGTATDQRGKVRPFDDPSIAPATGGDDSDIGSFEVQEVLNRAPDAKDDNATTNEDTPVSVDVLSNVTDPDGDAPQLTGVGTPVHGTATINDNGTPADKTDDFVTYTPNADYNGEDSFTYTVSDGKGGADTATVTIKVSAVNDAPTISNITDQSIPEDTNTGDLAFTVSDVDNPAGSLTTSGSSSDTTLVPNTNITFGGSNGSRTVKVMPAANRVGGPAAITVTVSDGEKTATDTFDVNVTPVNDAPTANAQSLTTHEDTDKVITLAGNDIDGDTLRYKITSLPTNGKLLQGTTEITSADLPFTLSSNQVTYDPNDNYNNTAETADSFDFKVNDGSVDSAVAAKVSITVNEDNDPPTISVAGGLSCSSNSVRGTMNLTIGDVDTPQSGLTPSLHSSNATLLPTDNITLEGSGANRTVTISAVPQKTTKSADITITVSDGQGGTATATIQVTVGTTKNETIGGTGGADMLFGQNGADTINAGDGNDLACGGNGNDGLRGQDGNDTLSGELGNDTLNGAAGADTMSGGLGADFFSGGADTDKVTDFSPSQGDTKDTTTEAP